MTTVYVRHRYAKIAAVKPRGMFREMPPDERTVHHIDQTVAAPEQGEGTDSAD